MRERIENLEYQLRQKEALNDELRASCSDYKEIINRERAERAENARAKQDLE